MESDRFESLLREGAAAIQQARLLRRTAHGLRGDSHDICVTARALAADSALVIDLLLDHVLCDSCLTQRAELPAARFNAVREELTRRFSSAKTIAAVCEQCGEASARLRLAN